ncbi:hypothetical protein [Draconibacterium orientale]|uniref:hypothetical protein n=1 Tax=Draconibacterium orientale TaxID=1168034 RepID=UPI002A0A9E5A|nr:hypothetical protein [Draconibacterium orientale]
MKKNGIAIIFLLAIATLILFVQLKPVFQYPNSVLYSKGGDALKNYFNFSYYLKYDDGIRHDGINYPYGDHLQYINSHPLYVQFVKFIDKHIYPVANHGVAILNLTMLALFLLALPFIFLILRFYSLPRWYAGIISLIILFLSPQFDRIHGHFEMVYAVFLPMFWYFLIRWRQGNKRILWSALLVLAALAGGFTSAYFVAFYSILLFGVLMVECWNHRKNLSGFWKTGLYLVAIAVLPLIIVKGLVSATDWVSDRPDNPYGFYVYYANFLSIFLPPGSQLKNILGNHINMDFQWEGRAYVGLPATLLAVSIFITGFYNLLSKRKSSWKIFKPTKKIEVFFYASILILLFSMCIPFKYGFGWLLDVLPPLKQFRALGRFSWIFYYVFTVYTAWFIYRIFRLLKMKRLPVLATTLLVFAIGYWAIDAGVNSKRSTRGLLNNNDKFESNNSEYRTRFQDAKVYPDEFQAIFFLPFASTCGDKLLFEHSLNGFSEAMKCSYHTGIPLIQSFSPRLSYSQALSSIQLLATPAIRKTRLDDMNDKPILLVCTKETLNDREKWLQSKAEVFWEDKYITLSRLPLSVFHDSYAEWHKQVESEIPTLQSFGEISTDTPINSILFNGFEDGSAKTVFSGNASFYSRKGQQVLLDKKIDAQSPEGKYELSFWLYVDSRKYDMPKAEVKVFDAVGRQKFYKRMNTRQVHDTCNGWIRVSEMVQLRPKDTLQLLVNNEYVSVDNLLVKPADANVLVKTSNQNFFNNYPL